MRGVFACLLFLAALTSVDAKGFVSKAFRGFPRSVREDNVTCDRLQEQDDICEFVKEHCELESYIQYLELYYCTFAEEGLEAVWFVVFVIWLAFLLALLGDTADLFFCDTLTSLKDITGVPANVAGVTFLALGNGAPDVFAAIAAITSENADQSDIGLAGLIGAGLFVTLTVFGIVAIVAPNTVHKAPFIRDVLCFMGATGLLVAFFFHGEVRIYEAVMFLVVYFLYVSVVVVVEMCYRRPSRLRADSDQLWLDEEWHVGDFWTEGGPGAGATPGFLDWSSVGQEQATRAGARMSSADEEIADMGAYAATNSLAQDLLRASEDENPSMFSRVYSVVKFPFDLIRYCTIPLVEKESWNKRYIIACSLLSPVLLVFVTELWDEKLAGSVPVWLVAVGVGLVLCVTVVFMCKKTVPRIRWPFALCGFIMAVIWIFAIAEELVDLLYSFGKILQISNGILGLTVLAWGNSLGDLVADVAIARRGELSMAVAGIFAGPTFNLLVGLGISLTVVGIRDYPDAFQFQRTLDVPVSLACLLFSLVFSLIVLPILRFELSRAFGVVLILVYVLAMVAALLVELDVFPNPYD